MYKKHLTKEQALQKLKHYCAYQERCHSEVKEKLFNLGVWKKEHDEIISTLIEENYLNEERFAVAYAGGHFRICLLYTSPSPRDRTRSRMPSSA